MLQSRWKSKAVWILILPVITLLGDTYGLWNIINMPKDDFSKLYMSLLTILVFLGYINNPTRKDGI